MSIEIITPQFDRTETLGFETPKTEEEFRGIVANAPTDILFDFGFRKWDTMNTVIADNQKLPAERNVTFPVIDLTGEGRDTVTLPFGRKENYPLEPLAHDEQIWLFPAEWYNLIPNGFKVTGLHGQDEVFERGVTDNDRRFGCLAYGIRRPLSATVGE